MVSGHFGLGLSGGRGLTELATEAGHWYAADGEPAYEIVGKNGKVRPTTLRDAKKLNLSPSVTTIIRCANAPGLTNYMIKQTLLAGAAIPRDPLEGDQAWMDRVFAKSREHSETARDAGTDIHGCIEKRLCDLAYDPTYIDHVAGALEALEEWCGIAGIKPEKSFCHELGYGGKVDVHKAGFVADFKSKDFNELNLPQTYENHAMQLAAYRQGFDMPTARCGIIYVSTSVPGLTHLVEIDEDELARGWNMFRALLTYWQYKNRYIPVFEPELERT